MKKENKAIKNRIIRDIRNLFEHEEENYDKPVIVGNFQSNNYSEYKRKGDRKTLWIKRYLNKTRPYLKDTINNLNTSDTWRIQLTITINFTLSKDDNDEGHAMQWKSDNIETMINDEADEVMEALLISK